MLPVHALHVVTCMQVGGKAGTVRQNHAHAHVYLAAQLAAVLGFVDDGCAFFARTVMCHGQ